MKRLTARRRSTSTRLMLEQLEGRRLMAADLWNRLGDFSNVESTSGHKLGASAASVEASVTLISFRNGVRETTRLGVSVDKLVVARPETTLNSPANDDGLRFERSVRPGLGVYSIDPVGTFSPISKSGKSTENAESAPIFIDPTSGAELVVWNEVVVALKPGVAPEAFFNEHSEFASYRGLTGTPDQFVATLREGVGRETIQSSNALARDSRVDWVQPNFYQSLKKYFTPNDTRFGNLWHLNNTGQSGGLIDADTDLPEAWDINAGQTSSIVIGIVDDGVSTDHPDLLNWVNPGEIAGDNVDNDGNGWIDDVNGWNFVSNNNQSGPTATTDRHGTSVAGVAAARGNNGQGVVGPAFQSRVMGVRIFEGNLVASDADIASAIYYTAGRTANGLGTWQAADVVNHSWGGGPASTAIEAALFWATTAGRQGRGATQFFATGNDFAASPSYPALYSTTIPGVIGVGATNNKGERSNYSNYGVGLDIVAPSSDTRSGYLRIDTTDCLGSLGYSSDDYTGTGGTGFGGTSSATPLSTGIGALTLAQAESQNVNLTPAQLRAYLRNTTDLIGGATYDGKTGTNFEFGYGRINAFTAVSGIGKAEISVVADSRELIDGASIVNFGSSFVGHAEERVVRIRNQGTQSLNLLSLSLPSSAFSIVGGLSTTVLGIGASTTFTLRFAPNIAGAFTSTVSLLTNDTDESLFDFQVTGTASVAAFSGYTFEDWSGNGQRNANDPSLAGKILYVDSNNNATLDTQNQNAVNTTSTPLPDLTRVVSNLVVAAPVGASINDLNVRINLNHTYVGDLKISVKHPDGTTIVLSNQRGGSGANFTNTVFDDEAAGSIAGVTSSNAPFTGSFRPDESLTTLDAKSMDGTWQLIIEDLGPGDSGVLNTWELIFVQNAEPVVVSGADGYFAFSSLPTGVPQTIRHASSDPGLVPTGSASHTFTLSGPGVGSTGDFGFGLVNRSYFRVFHDGNNDGVVGPLENGLVDRKLHIDVNGDGILTPTLLSSSTSPNTPIPDGQGIESLMAVSNLPTLHQILDLDVTLSINHPFVSDLSVYLMNPVGDFIALVSGAGNDGDDFTDTVFDDEAAGEIQSGTAPFTGSFRPLEPLGLFDGTDGSGIWRLFVFDDFANNAGSLVSWQLSFTVGDPIIESDSRGNAFIDVPNGNYTIRLQNDPGWVHTIPNTGVHTINMLQTVPTTGAN